MCCSLAQASLCHLTTQLLGLGVGGLHGAHRAAGAWGQRNGDQCPCQCELSQAYFWGRDLATCVAVWLLLLLCFPSSLMPCPGWPCVQLPALPGGHLSQLPSPLHPSKASWPSKMSPRWSFAPFADIAQCCKSPDLIRKQWTLSQLLLGQKNLAFSSLPQSSINWLRWPGGIFIHCGLFQNNLETSAP